MLDVCRSVRDEIFPKCRVMRTGIQCRSARSSATSCIHVPPISFRSVVLRSCSSAVLLAVVKLPLHSPCFHVNYTACLHLGRRRYLIRVARRFCGAPRNLSIVASYFRCAVRFSFSFVDVMSCVRYLWFAGFGSAHLWPPDLWVPGKTGIWPTSSGAWDSFLSPARGTYVR